MTRLGASKGGGEGEKEAGIEIRKVSEKTDASSLASHTFLKTEQAANHPRRRRREFFLFSEAPLLVSIPRRRSLLLRLSIIRTRQEHWHRNRKT